MLRMADSESDRERRAERRRRTWVSFISRTGEHPPMWRLDPKLALSVMWETAREAWLLSGRELPTYDRASMPGRVIRGGDRG